MDCEGSYGSMVNVILEQSYGLLLTTCFLTPEHYSVDKSHLDGSNTNANYG